MVYHLIICQSYLLHAAPNAKLSSMDESITLPKIEHAPQTLRSIVQDRMRAAIIDGHFAPGQRLIERPLCEQLGVSRTVIRETIRFLEAEGLVDILPNRGPIVARMDWDQARQIYDIRRQLETSAAMACAAAPSREFETRLRAALRQLEASFLEADAGHRFKASTRFYEVLFEEAGHTVAWEIVQRLNGRISRLRALTLSTTERAKPGLAHMTAICAAILDANPAAAEHAVRAHIQDASDIAQRLLSATEGQATQHG